jgi:hypothetical protein
MEGYLCPCRESNPILPFYSPQSSHYIGSAKELIQEENCNWTTESNDRSNQNMLNKEHLLKSSV